MALPNGSAIRVKAFAPMSAHHWLPLLFHECIKEHSYIKIYNSYKIFQGENKGS